MESIIIELLNNKKDKKQVLVCKWTERDQKANHKLD